MFRHSFLGGCEFAAVLRKSSNNNPHYPGCSPEASFHLVSSVRSFVRSFPILTRRFPMSFYLHRKFPETSFHQNGKSERASKSATPKSVLAYTYIQHYLSTSKNHYRSDGIDLWWAPPMNPFEINAKRESHTCFLGSTLPVSNWRTKLLTLAT